MSRSSYPFNPAIDLELPKEEHRLPANYLSEIEVELLLNQTDVKTPLGIRDRAILETLYSSAIRRNELLNLSIYDVDRNRRLLTIRQGKGKRDPFRDKIKKEIARLKGMSSCLLDETGLGNFLSQLELALSRTTFVLSGTQIRGLVPTRLTCSQGT